MVLILTLRAGAAPTVDRVYRLKRLTLSVACVGAILLAFAPIRLRLIRGSRLFWRWEWGAGSGVAGGEGRYAIRGLPI